MDPRHVLSAVLDDPPRIHGPDAPNGVWRTATECYEFLIDEVPKGSRTLETGMGVSTVLFAALETEHTSVSMGDATEELLSWCDEHDVPTSRLRLVNESSVTALPRIATEPDPLDVVFIDGCHGYPVVQLDWLYGCAPAGRWNGRRRRHAAARAARAAQVPEGGPSVGDGAQRLQVVGVPPARHVGPERGLLRAIVLAHGA